jgi:hypothetical protein
MKRDAASAIRLLRVVSTQPVWRFGVRTMPGPYSAGVREIANDVLGHVHG